MLNFSQIGKTAEETIQTPCLTVSPGFKCDVRSSRKNNHAKTQPEAFEPGAECRQTYLRFWRTRKSSCSSPRLRSPDTSWSPAALPPGALGWQCLSSGPAEHAEHRQGRQLDQQLLWGTAWTSHTPTVLTAVLTKILYSKKAQVFLRPRKTVRTDLDCLGFAHS